MSRLTYYGTPHMEEGGFVTPTYSGCSLRQIINKLAEYEDAEEQGMLFKSPCKIGEPIFVVPSEINFKLNVLNGYKDNNRVYEQVVCNFVFTKYGLTINTCDGVCHVRGHEYGKTWFLTRTEAEAALKKLQEGGASEQ